MVGVTRSRLRGAERYTTGVDAALAGILAAGAGVETLLHGGDYVALRAAFAVLTAASLVLRRRHPPISAALVAAGLALESLVTESPDEIAVLLCVLVSAFSVAAEAERREAFLGLGPLAMAVAVSISVDPSDEAANIPPTLMLFIVLPAVLGFAFHARGRDLAGLALRNEVLVRGAERAIDDERRRIARELHDVVSHAVTLIAVQAEAGQARFDDDPDSARRALAAIGDTSRDALSELHSLLALLRAPEEPTFLPGLAGLPALIEGVRAAGLTVDLRQVGVPAALPASANHAAYRVVQEGLTNALRHSRRPTVVVEVAHDPGQLRLSVTSRGAPHHSAYGGTGSGLVGLRERIESEGGSLESGRADRATYVVTAVLPVTS